MDRELGLDLAKFPDAALGLSVVLDFPAAGMGVTGFRVSSGFGLRRF